MPAFSCDFNYESKPELTVPGMAEELLGKKQLIQIQAVLQPLPLFHALERTVMTDKKE